LEIPHEPSISGGRWLSPDGAPAYKGDGRKVVVFGGIEIMPTLEQLF
jgi:hypothetical protein